MICKSIWVVGPAGVKSTNSFPPKINLNPTFMQQIFQTKEIKFDLRNKVLMSLPEATSQRFGTQSFVFRGSLLWNQIPENIKVEKSIDSFKSSLEHLNLSNICLCKLCT